MWQNQKQIIELENLVEQLFASQKIIEMENIKARFKHMENRNESANIYILKLHFFNVWYGISNFRMPEKFILD